MMPLAAPQLADIARHTETLRVAARARRQRFQQLIGDAVAIIPAHAEVCRSRDSNFPFRQNSDFWYLTAFPEPDAVLLLIGGEEPYSILFCRAKNVERELWDGHRFGPEHAAEVFGFDAAYPIEQLAHQLGERLVGHTTIHYPFAEQATCDQLISTTLQGLRQRCRQGVIVPHQLIDSRKITDAMRLIKAPEEQQIMTLAADISSYAHQQAMQLCRTGLYEYQIEAELTHIFRHYGAAGHAYTPIVAGGAHACILHYIENQQQLAENDLLLIDAGCEYLGYAADITRTFPVNGRFVGAARDCYEIVLAAEAAAIAAVRPCVSFLTPHDQALRVLVQGMLDLKLLDAAEVGSVEDAIEEKSYQRFFMHRCSHWLGLDVHDVGSYTNSAGDWCTLAEDMVLTIEPGLYIPVAEDIPKSLRGIGIRIEDDVRVTADGVAVYTTAPKSIADIESIMS